ncbi:Helix-turn-helix domain-containing protein [Actinacidiphila yanglinensis]|uniref:Helix-turn-helix domain-containing protein n=1 Tax=Actinacidiphila yanglinensis TaxID=310779 RepID=A0A1H6E1I4_9ACTN|nr:Helix-turn-helix domain-containing protein [Actinacidiphila yanglinensis]SEG91043.1 Helix-turn-helix domain-containing protein [Actinacidiphila yanglinensis]
MTHARWDPRSRPADAEYEDLYEDARLADELAQQVYDRRTELGLSQTQLAERADMKQPQISRIEGGATVPTLPLLRRLAKALEMDLSVGFVRPLPPPADKPEQRISAIEQRLTELLFTHPDDIPADAWLSAVAGVADLRNAQAEAEFSVALIQARLRHMLAQLVSEPGGAAAMAFLDRARRQPLDLTAFLQLVHSRMDAAVRETEQDVRSLEQAR